MSLPRYLCFYPNRLPERAYTNTDQLLEAGLREHELFRVLPYITVHGTSPGRGEYFGVIDIGTVLDVDNGNGRPVLDLDNYSGWVKAKAPDMAWPNAIHAWFSGVRMTPIPKAIY